MAIVSDFLMFRRHCIAQDHGSRLHVCYVSLLKASEHSDGVDSINPEYRVCKHGSRSSCELSV